MYTGTPKTVDNILSRYFFQKSTASEWVVACHVCGKHNILGLTNVWEKGIICSHCYKVSKRHTLLDTRVGRWLAQYQLGKKRYMRGFRMPQLLLAGIMDPDQYAQFYLKVFNADPITLYNEIIGLPFDTSEVPLREQDFNFSEDKNISIEDIQKTYPRCPKFVGIDWGLGLG